MMALRNALDLSRVAKLATALALSCGLALVAANAQAEKVGVAAAVNPDAFSSLAGKPQTQLNIGKSIFYNERINTTGSGLVQVLLVDGSTFTVGPGSDLVIDKFVYDPKKGTGQISASFSKGVMRFVGGKLSKNDGGVTVDTPAGALAIRGGIAYADFKSAASYSILFVFGDYLKMGGKTLYEPGYGWFMNNGLFQERQFNASDFKTMMASLTNSNTAGSTGNDNTKPAPPAKLFALQSLYQMIVDSTTEKIVVQAQDAAANQNEPKPEPQGPQGYAGGLYFETSGQNFLAGEGNLQSSFSQISNQGNLNFEVGVLANWTASDVGFKFNNDEARTFSAFFGLNVGMPGEDLGGLDINFGDPQGNPEIPRSFISETGGLAAFNTPGGTTIFSDGGGKLELDGEPFAFLVSSDFFAGSLNTDSYDGPTTDVPQQPPSEFSLCEECDFIDWGIWVTGLSFKDEGPEDKHLLAFGWWATGDIAPVSNIDRLAALGATATYEGTAIATVSTDLFSGPHGLDVYVATGDLVMDWNFGPRSGYLTISKFDTGHFGPTGLTFAGSMCAPGVTTCSGGPGGEWSTPTGNHFGGKLAGELPQTVNDTPLSQVDQNLNGFALGSFVRGPTNFENGQPVTGSVPQGVIGNWGIGNDRYMASGIFAGSR